MTYAEIKARMATVHRVPTVYPESQTLAEKLLRVVLPPIQAHKLDVKYTSTEYRVKQLARIDNVRFDEGETVTRFDVNTVESEAGSAVEMMLVANSGRFMGLGKQIVEL